MTHSRGIAFLIHDLNTWGGQDRSTLEVARRVSHRLKTEVHAFTLADAGFPKNWGENARFLRVTPNLSRPVLLKSIYFYLWTWLRFFGKHELIHCTGASSLRRDIIQVQFVHAAAKKGPARFGPRGLYHAALARFDRFMERRLFTLDKTYIAISKAVADELRTHFDIHEHVYVIHHGVDPDDFKPTDAGFQEERKKIRSELGVRDDELMFLLVGSFERKGLKTAIESLSKLSDSTRAKIKLVGIGGGDTRSYLEQIERLGLKERVVLRPPQKQISRFFRSADAFLFPTQYEPFGMVILEAMSCGLPVIVSQVAGASELIKDGLSGLVIRDFSDSQEIADLISKTLANPELRARLSAEARKVALANTWDHVAEKYLQVFEKRLAEASA